MSNIEIVNGYFAAYQAGDYKELSTFFHPQFEFSDPPFQNLTGGRAKAMFHMFCTTREKTQLVVTPSPAVPIPGEDAGFRVEYTCDYVYGGSKPVHNEITGIITIRDGKIKRHADNFDLGLWGKQALGWALGGGLNALGLLEVVVRRGASQRLDEWCGRYQEFKQDEGV